MNTRTIAEIRKACQAGYTSSSDIVSSLASSGWCEESDLGMGLESLKNTEDLNAAAFFQTASRFAVSPPKGFPIRWDYGQPELLFTLHTAHRNNVAESSRLVNQLYQSDPITEYTQVRIVFSIWGRRRNYYQAYLDEIGKCAQHSRRHIVRAASSWKHGQPLTAETYESDLCSRLYHESLRIMKRVVETYSTLARSPATNALATLPNFFVMMKNGRLVTRPKHTNTELEPLIPYAGGERVKATDLSEAIANSSKVSDYERFLVDAIQHINSGSPNLAIVQAVMILDWFANTILADRLIKPIRHLLSSEPPLAEFVIGKIWESKGQKSQIRVRTMDKFKEYFPLAGIFVPPQLLSQLKSVISLRNDIVHKRQVESVKAEVAQEAVGNAVDIVRHAMGQMVLTSDSD